MHAEEGTGQHVCCSSSTQGSQDSLPCLGEQPSHNNIKIAYVKLCAQHLAAMRHTVKHQLLPESVSRSCIHYICSAAVFPCMQVQQRRSVACAATHSKLGDSISLLQADGSPQPVACLVGVPAGAAATSAAVQQQVRTRHTGLSLTVNQARNLEAFDLRYIYLGALGI
jgi:hypothetical protein